MLCKKCGAEVQPGLKFCNYCGEPLENPEIIKCPKCQSVCDVGTAYCPNCGASIMPLNKPEAPKPEYQQNTPFDFEKTQTMANYSNFAPPPANNGRTDKKKIMPIVIIASAVVVAVVAILLIVLLSDDDSSEKTSTSSKTKVTTEAEEVTEEEVIVVDDYEDKSYEMAQEELEDLGFIVELEYEYSDSVREDYVISQSIDAGTDVSVPTTITLTVSMGEEPTEAPEPEPDPPSQSDTTRLEFTYYSIDVPSDWYYSENGTTVTFYEGYNYDNGDGHSGRLFSIYVFSSMSEVENHQMQGCPRSEVINQIDGLYFVCTKPTDVQYLTGATAENEYKEAQNKIDSVLDSMIYY